jgi:RNA polymerase sigma-70 factor (ECF subfamily)
LQSDSELVSACLDGSKAAFEALVRRYERPVRAAALSVLGDFHRAEDATQEAFIRAWKKLPGLRNQAAFGPWITKIARHSAINIARRRIRVSAQRSTLAKVIEQPDGRLESDKQKLLDAVMKLPKAHRHLIMLRYFSKYPVKELAGITGRSIGTITKQLSRARKQLRTHLERAER